LGGVKIQKFWLHNRKKSKRNKRVLLNLKHKKRERKGKKENFRNERQPKKNYTPLLGDFLGEGKGRLVSSSGGRSESGKKKKGVQGLV